MRFCLALCTLARCASAGVVVDPSKFDSSLKSCNTTATGRGDAHCGADRVCHVDPKDSGKEVCLHKQLLGFSARDFAGTLALLCGMALAASAGIGGGGLNVPILLLVFGFTMEESVVLSNAAVMGNGIAQFLVNFRRRHPHDASITLIDWDAVLMLLPAQLGGGNVGVIVGAVFPSTVLMVLSIALLALAATKTMRKALQQRAAESAGSTPAEVSSEAPVPPLAEIVPWRNVAVVLAVAVAFSLDSVLLKDGAVGIRTCSGAYWLPLVAMYPLILATAVWGARHVASRQRAKTLPLEYAPLADDDETTAVGVPVGDVDWSQHALTAPAVGGVVGVISALLGLGGGELLGPVLLSLGMAPRRSSATTATTSVLSTLANFAHYAVQGEIARSNFLSYALWVMFVGLVGGLVGRLGALRVAASGRASSISLALGVVLFISLGLMIYDTATTKFDLHFHNFCSS